MDEKETKKLQEWMDAESDDDYLREEDKEQDENDPYSTDEDPDYQPDVAGASGKRYRQIFNDSSSSSSSEYNSEGSDMECNEDGNLSNAFTYDETWHIDTNVIPDFNFDINSESIRLDAQDNVTPHNVFSKIWDAEVDEIILNSVNAYGNTLNKQNRPHQKNSRFLNFNEVTQEEMNIFMGLCLLQGQIRFPSLRSMFSEDPLYHHPIFSKMMSGRRFEQILRCFSCQYDPRYEADTNDRLSKIKNVFTRIIANSQNIYSPGKNLALDESMLLFRGRLFFKQYIKGKKSKYGIKFYELCTSDGYVLNMEIYKGRDSEKNDGESKVDSLVLRLLQPYLNKGHSVFMDNYYNSVGLCRKLLKKQTHCTGTLRSNRKGNPKDVIGRKLKKGEHVWRRNGELYVSKWKDKREVLAITTAHHPELITVRNKYNVEKVKPIEIDAYNRNMSGIDRSDQMISYYSSPRKSLRWYTKVLFHLVDIAVWNAFYLYRKLKNKPKMSLIQFRDELITSLLGIQNTCGKYSNSLTPGKTSKCKRPAHYQEKIPAPKNFNRKNYYLNCVMCKKNKTRKQTSWRCRDCHQNPPLCPGPCFEKWHTS